jgi:hypothetical protein
VYFENINKGIDPKMKKELKAAQIRMYAVFIPLHWPTSPLRACVKNCFLGRGV